MTGSLYRKIITYYIPRGRLHAGSDHESFYSIVHGTEWQIKNKTKQNPCKCPWHCYKVSFNSSWEAISWRLKLAIQMTCLGVHLISATPLSRSISTNSKSVLLPSTHLATCHNTFCFIFSWTGEFYDLQEGENARFAMLASSRSSETTSLERRKWNQNNKTEAARAPTGCRSCGRP